MSDEVTCFVCVFFLLVLIHLITTQISTFLNSFNPLIFYWANLHLKQDSLLCLICAFIIMSASRKDFVGQENLIGQWPNS